MWTGFKETRDGWGVGVIRSSGEEKHYRRKQGHRGGGHKR